MMFLTEDAVILNNLSFAGKLSSELTDKLIDKIIVYDKDRIEIKWKIPLAK